MTPVKIDSPEISVIVPIYRVERFLPQCIDSILKQTFQDIEVILVDDGSDDGCPAICDAAAERDARVRVIHQKNQGLSVARNTGIRAAQGGYIAFADSDDYMEPNMLEMMLGRMKKDGSELAVCNYHRVDEQGRELSQYVRESPISEDEVITDQSKAVEKLCIEGFWHYIIASNKLYARRLFDDIRFPEGRRNEDIYVAYQVLWKAKGVSILKDLLFVYRLREGSIIKSKPTVKMLDAADGWFECCRFALDKKADRLAVRGYNGAISEISVAWHTLDRKEEEVRCAQRLPKESERTSAGSHETERLFLG